MSNTRTQDFFQMRKKALLDSIEAMEIFLKRQKEGIAKSPEPQGAITHLNMRLLLQVHTMALIDSSADYDRAVWELLAEDRMQDELKRREQVLVDAGVIEKPTKGKK